METRYTHSPEDIRHYTTEQLRKEFLVEKIFVPGEIMLTYTHNDRQIFGGVTPTNEPLEIRLSKELGVDYFLERRELGVINIGGPGSITIEDKKDPMKKQDGYYIGKGTKDVVFESDDPTNPAKFYVVSVPAHHKYPNVKISIDQITPRETGEDLSMNKRKIYQYIHPNICESCQLQMGYTVLEPGNAWNTMPSHTHERRMETYLYFDMESDTRVFHFMGKPDETKHLILSSEQAVISPSWSIHCGVATSNYTFIWAMCGENITYDDMDFVPMEELK
ncbi:MULTISPECIES: 5-dehydro-4-deoxy-D-glucuronate isomerase [Heyndrickxia]|jgi:4-deoxy-L-threo-5-hexosulose-uronate ketol-isomerase|uniref:4-deoxy-L-threo-5-hexosulose-uronate ketol-isomerase n=2 Tax=Heyndrickxia TaxID=2837504 RepID=A0AAW7CM78_HEYCO|nr:MULTISPECIES: 5-dehydro-4-deoxy-D-glucuronate isomerase [Heyndrickxia]NWN93756.1 5-dehydro-4-deoxy-D-glucuronate isomerase [Bacillus sp. (in: firmicutes)]MCI1575104.1 5-dehydro-4-deoxy-D-glucuronate isomerase [Heyndrickxia coagulans]MDL5042405.1 5-dehydro-4-deoxy-D-glucuronate isomerase [Heyndrickxia coagulans]MED4838814.1 5-dehydro-4-deoxy-D-glucuronate isomerase [Weizmannia sp. CD-2023]MED4892561.1 5-dehydro-4-deoxy-D-glucuronate isomerase [Weizmannia sp. CD-2023]